MDAEMRLAKAMIETVEILRKLPFPPTEAISHLLIPLARYCPDCVLVGGTCEGCDEKDAQADAERY
jgi:hypothetical protein